MTTWILLTLTWLFAAVSFYMSWRSRRYRRMMRFAEAQEAAGIGLIASLLAIGFAILMLVEAQS